MAASIKNLVQRYIEYKVDHWQVVLVGKEKKKKRNETKDQQMPQCWLA
jgi:hypothetical protein